VNLRYRTLDATAAGVACDRQHPAIGHGDGRLRCVAQDSRCREIEGDGHSVLAGRLRLRAIGMNVQAMAGSEQIARLVAVDVRQQRDPAGAHGGDESPDRARNLVFGDGPRRR